MKAGKLSEENIGVHGLGLGRGFSDMASKAQVYQGKMHFECIKMKNFCASRGTIQKVKNTTHTRGGNFCKS